MSFTQRMLVMVGACGALQFTHVATVRAQNGLAWTLSSSNSDPFANTLIPGGSVVSVYLWLCRATTAGSPCGEGMSQAQFGLSPSPGGPIILASQPATGFVNSGTATCLELSAEGCPTGPVIAATILVIPLPGNICFVSCNDVQGGVGCVDSSLSGMGWDGLDVGGGPCTGGISCRQHFDFLEACCLPDGSCADVLSYCECEKLGGELQGYPSACTQGACCLPDGTCVQISNTCGECTALGGEFHFFMACDAVECETTAIERTSWGETKAVYR